MWKRLGAVGYIVVRSYFGATRSNAAWSGITASIARPLSELTLFSNKQKKVFAMACKDSCTNTVTLNPLLLLNNSLHPSEIVLLRLLPFKPVETIYKSHHKILGQSVDS